MPLADDFYVHKNVCTSLKLIQHMLANLHLGASYSCSWDRNRDMSRLCEYLHLFYIFITIFCKSEINHIILVIDM